MHQIFPYFGSKMRLARKYGQPDRSVVIEPFAGAAGYSVYWGASKAILFDLNDDVVKTWRFVIEAGKRGGDPIRQLPLLDYGESVPDIEGKELIGFWCIRGVESPRKSLGGWAKDYPNRFWGEYQRERLARDSVQCANWEITLGDYTLADGLVGEWFIDPPYQQAGKHYKHPFTQFDALAEFCRRQHHSVTVCEEEADSMPTWLPFERVPWKHVTMNKRQAQEVVWRSGQRDLF